MGIAGLVGGAALGAIAGNNSGSKQKQSEKSSQKQQFGGSTSQNQWQNITGTTISQSKSGSTSTAQTTATPVQQQYQLGLLNAATQLMGNMPSEYYPEWDTVADLSPYQLLGMQSLGQAAETQAGYLPTATSTVFDMLSGKPNTEMWSPMMDLVRQQITSGFKEDVLPSMASEALQYGGYGGAGYNQSLDIGAGRVAQSLANAETQMAFEAMRDAQNQRATALQALPSISQMGYQPGMIMQGIGQTLQGQEQAELGANLERYMANLYGPLQTMSWYSSLLGQDMGTTTAQKAQTSGWENETQKTQQSMKGGQTTKSSGWQNTQSTGSASASQPGSAWQGALGGLSLAAALSDRRVKKNVRKIGTYKGHNLYEFDYVWGGHAIGVMAQEVPHAAYRVGHLLAVDYRRL